jgi:hypothetical protein
MAEATVALREAVKNPNCTMVDLVKAGTLMKLQEDFENLKF